MTQAYTESITFTIQAEEVATAVSGMIGYYFKVYRGSGSSYPDASQSNQVMSSGYPGQ